MTEHPIERLRNKLTPFMNLPLMAKVMNIKFENPKEEEIFKETLEVCKKNASEINHWLTVAENAIQNDTTRIS